MITIKNLAIKTNNQAEKLAALYFMASKIGCKISEIILEDTIKNVCINAYPIVYYYPTYINATFNAPEDFHLVEFSELSNIDKILEKLNKPKIEVGKRYYYSNKKSFIVPISVEGSNKYVLGGCKGCDFNLYNNGEQMSEAEIIERLGSYLGFAK